MLGKSMRCPSCQEVFIVKDAGPDAAPPTTPEKPPASAGPPRTRTDAPHVVSRTGSVTDFVPVIRDVSAAVPPSPPRPTAPPPAAAPPRPQEPPRSDKVKPPKPSDFPWEEGPKRPTVSPSAPPSRADKPKAPPTADFPWDEGPKPKPKPSAPKEITWSPDLQVPAPAAIESAAIETETESPIELEPAVEEESEAPPAVVRPPKKHGRRAILLVLLAFVLTGLGTGGYFLWRYINLAPERYFAAAKKEYDAAQYDQARSLFQKVATEYPEHDLAPEARFFSELSLLRHTVSLLGSKEDPQPGLNQWKGLLKSLEDPNIKPFGTKQKFALDVWEAGIRLVENMSAKAAAVFNDEAPEESEKWLAEAENALKTLEQFRPDDATVPESIGKEIAALRKRMNEARDRLAKLKELEKAIGDGSDENVNKADELAKVLGMAKDPGYQRLKEEKERQIQARATYTREPQPVPPTAVPDDGLTSLLFAPRFDRGDRRPIAGVPSVFFCLARGVLYSLDEADGRVLWAARTGLDTDIMPVRVPASDQNPELVLIASNTGHQFGITARAARDGTPLWHQPLGVPCQGPPVVVGPNAYVSVGDPDGTVLEIALATGDIIGRITIGRPLGPNIAARQGTGLLYIPSESRAVYVFDVHRRDADGKRLDPILLGVMTTGHLRGSLRGVPVFSNPDPNEPGPRYLVLGQADGLDSMKLRAFRLPDALDGPPNEGPPVEITLPGWASFPPYCDGEKLAIVTDKGEFGLYGLALAGNRDLALFAFPAPPSKPGEPRPSRGQVVLAEEGSFWILAAGELRKMRFGINAADGVRLIPTGDPIPVGEPLHNPQTNTRRDTFVVVTQEGMTCRATAVNALTGEVRWRRELGLMAKGDPLRIGDDILMLDHGGGFYRVDTKTLSDRGGATWLVDDRWLVAQPARGYLAVTGLMRGPNNTALAVLAGEIDNKQLLIRKYNGSGVEELKWTAPEGLAGHPVISGRMLILPLANGTLYRMPVTNLAIPEAGLSWRADRMPATTTCYLAPINEDELFATDGARTIVRWNWPANSRLFEMNGRLSLPERPAATPVVLPGSPTRFVVADARGNLTMWDGNELKFPALKAWRPGPKNSLPQGPVSDGLRLEHDPGGGIRIVYIVDGRMVWLSPDADGPKWVGPPPIKAIEGRPIISGDRVLLTDRAGVIRVLDIETGRLIPLEFRLTGSHAFASAAVPVGETKNVHVPLVDGFGVFLGLFEVRAGGRVLVPLVDGTVVLGELRPRPVEAKKEPDKDAEPEEKKAAKSKAGDKK
jgi:outer membrane protein assembly factor BamB